MYQSNKIDPGVLSVSKNSSKKYSIIKKRVLEHIFNTAYAQNMLKSRKIVQFHRMLWGYTQECACAGLLSSKTNV